MLKFSLYIVIFAVVFFWGLAVGSANGTVVSFDFLFLKTDLSVSAVFAVGIGVGILLGIYASLLFCLRVWRNAHQVKSEFKRYKKSEHKQLKTEQNAKGAD
ncbi:Predicted membrane protein [Anaerobiospirillum thomasii]|uniref:Predicted membrane protein n=1 Tax=Anaerobiospirillum thomasii TaxID=179995 RepID=A0A2X0V5P6_9GAMM|nr:lipopolysaccharide assembly protein LapA domain-containing protein [Anaerobiospirillum thomasii]SPT68416.1 Predicted membrane protein [Anaerobiospirillum thomasii]SPT70922.1 Predicted membrane protein [Anaerobiospirillum thomasii]